MVASKLKKKNLKIEFHFIEVTVGIEEKKISKWINHVVQQHQKDPNELNIIFCNDEYLLEINKQYLNHDYYTDIITFPHSEEEVYGDLYISIDRVRENAKNLSIDQELEILRVIIHGVLHLLGFKDKTKKEIEVIRKKEDEAISLYKKEFLLEHHYYDQVYEIVSMIPKGKVTNDGAISDFLALGSARMVGYALNPLTRHHRDHIPAHRVVNAKGELSGKNYFGGNIMQELLEAEGILIEKDKIINFDQHFWNPKFM